MLFVNEDVNFIITPLSIYVVVYYFFFILFGNGNIVYAFNYKIDLNFKMYTWKGNTSHQINKIHRNYLHCILNQNSAWDTELVHMTGKIYTWSDINTQEIIWLHSYMGNYTTTTKHTKIILLLQNISVIWLWIACLVRYDCITRYTIMTSLMTPATM